MANQIKIIIENSFSNHDRYNTTRRKRKRKGLGGGGEEEKKSGSNDTNAGVLRHNIITTAYHPKMTCEPLGPTPLGQSAEQAPHCHVLSPSRPNATL